MPIEVTAKDTETGETNTVTVGDGPTGWLLITGAGCHLAHTQWYKSGTTVLTIKKAE